MNWDEARHNVGSAGSPSNAFLDELLSLIKPLPDVLFEPNAHRDLYSLIAPPLGPWTSTAHRKAAMAEALVCDGGFESEWNWNEGVDTTNAYSMANPIGEETGLWQVSADSMALDPSLRAFISEKLLAGNPNPSIKDLVACFIPAMKENHALAVEYAIRLFRVNTRWSGPCNRGWIADEVSRDAVAEWQTAFAS